MKQKTITINRDESITFDDLTITIGGGGHKILMTEDGKRGGDLSFAEVTFKTPRNTLQQRIFHPQGNKETEIDFDSYHIEILDMEWNGTSVKLRIQKKD